MEWLLVIVGSAAFAIVVGSWLASARGCALAETLRGIISIFISVLILCGIVVTFF